MGKSKRAIQSRGLSPEEKREKLSLIQGFSDYWNHVKFDLESTKEGTIKRLLDEAIEATILIKSHLKKQNPNVQIRLNSGGVREYLLNLEAFPASEREFVAGVVKSTFAYSDGFIGNLKEEEIDGYLDLVLKSHLKKNLESTEDIRQLEKETKEAFKETHKLAQEIFTLIDEHLNTNPSYHRELTKMHNGILNLKNTVTRFHEALKSRIKDRSDDSSEADKDETQSISDGAMSETDEPSGKGIEIKITNEELKPPTSSEFKTDGNESTTTTTSSSSSTTTTATSDNNNDNPVTATSNNPDATPAAVNEPEDPSATKNVLVVNKVASEVGQIQEGLQSLSNDVKILDLQQLVKNPSEGKKLVDKLHQRCIGFSESLMRDLTTLDELTLRQEDRPKRKEQVKKIQSMVSDVDNLLSKLHELVEIVKKEETKLQQIEEENKRAELEKQQKAKEEESKKAEQEKVKPAEKKNDKEKEKEKEKEKDPPRTLEDILANILQHQEKKTKNELDFQGKKEEFRDQLMKQAQRLEPYWRRMKLNPRMDAEEDVDRYIVSTYIPGMNEEDISIGCTEERGSFILSIKGHRSPTLQELALMRRQLARSGIEPDDDETILKMGIGRFGTFLEKYAIPRNVETSEIRGQYEGGELVVVLPKIKVRQFPTARGFNHQPIPLRAGPGATRYPVSRGFESTNYPNLSDAWW